MALGVLLPDSRPLAVSMETPIRWANAGCVTPSLPRMSLISEDAIAFGGVGRTPNQ